MTEGKLLVRLRKDVDIAIRKYIETENSRITGNPGFKATRSAVVNEVLMNYLAEKGYYKHNEVE